MKEAQRLAYSVEQNKSPLVKEAQRLVGRSLYQKFPQVVSGEGGAVRAFADFCLSDWPYAA